MRTKMNFKLLFSLFLVGLQTINMLSQESKSKHSEFLIEIKMSENEIKLKNMKESNWKELTYKKSKNKAFSFLINKNGMYQLQESKLNTRKKVSNFVFTVNKTEKGLKLKGIKGTKWKDLELENINTSYSFFINQNGMYIL